MDEPIHNGQNSGAQEARVGVYVCHCGGNISDVVDVKAVAESARRKGQVHVARDYVFMCSDPGQKLIIEDIQNNGVNRVVVSACSPTLHELTFRKTLERAGLNPYLYEHINIREQCSWVHKGNHEGATDKATRLTSAGVEKVSRQDPLEPIRVQAERHVVVLGGGVAGMRAALSLARRGIGVTLIESSGALGGRVAELQTVYPTEDRAVDLLEELRASIAAEQRISVHLHSDVEKVDGYVGRFTVRIRTRSPGAPAEESQEVVAGVIILATGFDHYKPLTGELGYGESPDVLTLPEFNRLLAEHPASSRLQHHGREVRSVAFIHCVGSRQVEGIDTTHADGKVNDYCSRYCCTATLHAVNRALDRFPDLNVYDLYKDIRTYGRGHEDLYESASRKGALFFRFKDDGRPEVGPSADRRSAHAIRVTDWLSWGEEVIIPVDMVVLATGMVPRDISALIGMLKLPTGTDRFLQEVHPKLRPVELANNGILLAGTCQGPMNIGEACAAAEAAASKASILLANPTITLDPFVARVDSARCDGCGACLEECSYDGALAMTGLGDRSVVAVNPALCAGCGACAAACGPRAISLAGWSLDQFDAMVDAISAETERVPAGV